jgi:putative ABC transport system permease protein
MSVTRRESEHMSDRRGADASERWFRLLLRLYPEDFRDEMGAAVMDGYRQRARHAWNRGGVIALAGVWLTALMDSFRNGLGERARPAISWRRTGDWGRDLERVRRRLWRKPMFFVATVGTLTVGLGTFAVVYTAVDKILLEPLPFRDPADLYMVWANSPGLEHLMVTGPDVAELQAAGGVIEDAAAFQFGTPTLPPANGADAERIDAVISSANLFDLLGVEAALGRVFQPDDGRPDAADVVVLSDGLWKRLGADPAIVGSTLRLSTVPYTVIGVMPPEFQFAGNLSRVKPDAYVPYQINLATQVATDANFRAVIRAQRGTPPEQARQAVDRVGSFVGRRDFKTNDRTLFAIGLHTELVEAERPALLSLAFTAVFLVLALTVNLASLLLARAAEREREFAVSRALGASGSVVARATLLEGALLGLLGGLAGALAGVWGTGVLVALGPATLPRRETIVLDGGNAALVIAVGVLLGVIAAALPAIWAARVSMVSLSSAFVRGTAGSGRMRRALVVAQIAVSLVLLSAGALVTRSFERLLAADPGFRSDGMLTFGIGISGGGIFGEDENAYAFLDQLDAAVTALPGVTAVSATTQLPLSGGGNVVGVNLPGASDKLQDMGPEGGIVSRIFIRGGYIEAMGLRLREGRGPQPSPGADAREALIDQLVTRYLFPNGGAIGATLMSGGRPLTVVGIVDQPRLFELHQDDRTPQIFVRAEDFRGRRPGTYVVRTSGDPYLLIPHVRQAIRQIDPRVPVSSMQTMEDVVSAKRSRERMSAVLIAGLALGALLLAAMGIFGVIAGTVTRRRGELAVRLALGATHRRVLRLIMGEGALLVALGLLIGAPGVYVAGDAIRGLLIDLSPWDPPTLLAVALGLAIVAMVACYAPARRVLRIDPAPLLRQE